MKFSKEGRNCKLLSRKTSGRAFKFFVILYLKGCQARFRMIAQQSIGALLNHYCEGMDISKNKRMTQIIMRGDAVREILFRKGDLDLS